MTQSFDELLKAGKIKTIKIVCIVESGVKHFEALVTTEDKKVHTLPIADADSFVFNLDHAIGEFAAQGSPINLSEKFTIE